MAGTPRRYLPGTSPQEIQQSYMDQFNNAQYAAIPGVRGPQQPPPASPPGMWNGRPIDPNYVPSGNGWGAVGSQLGNILPGIRSEWMNANLSNADWQTFLPQGGQPMGGGGNMQNHMLQVAPPAAMTGPYGRQAAQMAGLLGAPSGGAPSGGGGLLGGRTRAFRIPPGGK